MKFLITIIKVLLFSSAYCQLYQVGDSLSVNAYGGLNLRDQPSIESKATILLEYGKKVLVISTSAKKDKHVINNLEGHWIEIETKRDKGYVFDAYLTKLPVVNIEADYKENCFKQLLIEYLITQLGVIDTAYYTTAVEGDGYHDMRIIDLQGGHQYIEHGYWEAREFELQLRQIRSSEGIQLVKNLLQSCRNNTQGLEQQFENYNNPVHVNIDEMCCSVSMRYTPHLFILKLQEGP